VKRLAGIDAAFLYLETPAMHLHVVGSVLLDPSTAREPFTRQRMVDLVRERIHLLEPFRRRVATVPFNLSHPVWVEDPDFDVEAHVHATTLRSPGTLKELADLVGDIASRPLDRSRPLWELWVVDGVEDGQIAFVTKIHHAAIDGITGADLMAHLFDLSPDVGPVDPPDQAWQPDAAPSDVSLTVDALRHVVSNPLRLAKLVRRTAALVVDVVQQTRTGEDDTPSPALPFMAPRTRWSGSITPHRSVAFGAAQLDDIKAVKSTFGTTVNDVVLTACTMTLRSYLAAHDDLPDQPLVCTVPVSVHGKTEHDSINQVSSMFVRLPVQLDDPVEVLRSIQGETKAAKVMQNAIGADALQDFAQFIPPAVFNQAMRLYSGLRLADRHRPVHNLVISNVPGPPVPLYAAGARVKGVVPLGPLMEGAGLNITVLSNMGNVDFGVIGCRELVPDIWDIADGFGSAVTELRARADAEAAPAPRPAVRRPSKKSVATARD
jgi:WS/DGAT/MGAT family acyltransferase